jgi:phosphocarrier protein HPr
MKKIQLTITCETGLHARPASVFVQAAKQFKSRLSIRNLTKNSGPADAKSILAVLVLGVEKNHRVDIEADGADEQEALDCLEKLIRSDFQIAGSHEKNEKPQ